MFYRQIVIHRGLPFAVQYPSRSLINAATLTETQLDTEVTKGLDDIAAGRKRSFAQAWLEHLVQSTELPPEGRRRHTTEAGDVLTETESEER